MTLNAMGWNDTKCNGLNAMGCISIGIRMLFYIPFTVVNFEGEQNVYHDLSKCAFRKNCHNTASWVGVDSDGFLGRTQVARWVAMICMAKKLLHGPSRKGLLAQVYVHFLRWVLVRYKGLSGAEMAWAEVESEITVENVTGLPGIQLSNAFQQGIIQHSPQMNTTFAQLDRIFEWCETQQIQAQQQAVQLTSRRQHRQCSWNRRKHSWQCSRSSKGRCS